MAAEITAMPTTLAALPSVKYSAVIAVYINNEAAKFPTVSVITSNVRLLKL
jgi:hypothetical protein